MNIFKELLAESHEDDFWESIDSKPDINPNHLDNWYHASKRWNDRT